VGQEPSTAATRKDHTSATASQVIDLMPQPNFAKVRFSND